MAGKKHEPYRRVRWFSTIALTIVFEVLRRRPSASAPEATRGLDGAGKISKDMAMTAMPRIGARRSCVDEGSCGVAEQ